MLVVPSALLDILQFRGVGTDRPLAGRDSLAGVNCIGRSLLIFLRQSWSGGFRRLTKEPQVTRMNEPGSAASTAATILAR